ncbi:LpxD N-terminal domain-containing protein [Haloarcula amylovorans]|uniref:LpxD N-terminal domain-containing protein n=1 Tax=Haloarcula amylovorans TaxID=2562280 RepID=UPI0010760BFC|nr:LpxD N-terminal domain-containing protein [Halomicroarcula amylolytica]
MTTAHSTTEIAAELDLEHAGSTTEVTGVDSLDRAGKTDLAFSVYDEAAPLADSAAGAVICPPSVTGAAGKTLIHAENPKLAFAEAVEAFFGSGAATGVHPTAVVEDGATIGENCTVGPHAYIADCVTIGDGCTIRTGTRIGGPGFGFVRDDEETLHRLPHQGTVRIEDGVEIGENCTINRAVFEETVLHEGAKVSGQVHIAHHVHIGEDTTVAFGCGFAGGAVVGDRVTVHPHVSVATDVTVGDDAELAMNAAVLDDVARETTVAGSPAREIG